MELLGISATVRLMGQQNLRGKPTGNPFGAPSMNFICYPEGAGSLGIT